MPIHLSAGTYMLLGIILQFGEAFFLTHRKTKKISLLSHTLPSLIVTLIIMLVFKSTDHEVHTYYLVMMVVISLLSVAMPILCAVINTRSVFGKNLDNWAFARLIIFHWNTLSYFEIVFILSVVGRFIWLITTGELGEFFFEETLALFGYSLTALLPLPVLLFAFKRYGDGEQDNDDDNNELSLYLNNNVFIRAGIKMKILEVNDPEFDKELSIFKKARLEKLGYMVVGAILMTILLLLVVYLAVMYV